MVATKYTFSIADDMPGGAVNPGRLKAEIDASAIVTALIGVHTVADDLDTWFVDALSSGDETILHGDTTDPAGGLLAAHDNSAFPAPKIIVVEADPEVTAVDAPEGSIITWGCEHYCKMDDGETINVELMGHIDQRDGESGGTLINVIEYSSDPTPTAGDLWIRNTEGSRELVFFDGTDKHSVDLTQE